MTNVIAFSAFGAASALTARANDADRSQATKPPPDNSSSAGQDRSSRLETLGSATRLTLSDAARGVAGSGQVGGGPGGVFGTAGPNSLNVNSASGALGSLSDQELDLMLKIYDKLRDHPELAGRADRAVSDSMTAYQSNREAWLTNAKDELYGKREFLGAATRRFDDLVRGPNERGPVLIKIPGVKDRQDPAAELKILSAHVKEAIERPGVLKTIGAAPKDTVFNDVAVALGIDPKDAGQSGADVRQTSRLWTDAASNDGPNAADPEGQRGGINGEPGQARSAAVQFVKNLLNIRNQNEHWSTKINKSVAHADEILNTGLRNLGQSINDVINRIEHYRQKSGSSLSGVVGSAVSGGDALTSTSDTSPGIDIKL